jgi:hypothetical protein
MRGNVSGEHIRAHCAALYISVLANLATPRSAPKVQNHAYRILTIPPNTRCTTGWPYAPIAHKRLLCACLQMPPMMHSLPQPMTGLQAGGAGALGGFTAPAQQRLKLQDSSELDEQVMLQIMRHASVGGATDAF